MESEEREEDAIERITEEITERFERDQSNMEEALEALTEAKIPHYSVRARDRLTRVRYLLLKVHVWANLLLMKLKRHRQCYYSNFSIMCSQFMKSVTKKRNLGQFIRPHDGHYFERGSAPSFDFIPNRHR